MSKVTETRWFKSGKVDFSQASRIDAENGIILGVIMCQVGEALGHGVWLEQEFMDAGIAYAQKHHAQKGMKARFGHPSMSNETLGTEMGRFKNFRVEADKMVADLHLFESADLSPTQPGMRKWMLSMAKEDPSAIMCSIVFKIASFYQRDPEGNKYDIEYKREDYSGFWVSKDSKYKFDPDGKIYVSLKELMFCDIVDQGAATDKLFSAQFNAEHFSVIATDFLNENPAIDAFLQERPDKLIEFINKRFGIESAESQSLLDRLLGLFQNKQTNQHSYYMGKIQLPKLAELAEKLGKNEASANDFAAFQAELNEQGVDVVVLGAGNHQAITAQLQAYKDNHAKCVLVLAPDSKPEEIEKINLSELITKALSAKDEAIKQLTTERDALKLQLGTATPPTPAPVAGQQQFTPDPVVESAGEKELKALQSLMAEANQLSN